MAGVFVRYVLPYGTDGFASAARMLLHAFGILLPGELLYNFTGLMG